MLEVTIRCLVATDDASAALKAAGQNAEYLAMGWAAHPKVSGWEQKVEKAKGEEERNGRE